MSHSMGGGSSSSGRARLPLRDLGNADSDAVRGRSKNIATSRKYTEDAPIRSKRSARSSSTSRRQRLRSTAASAENSDPVGSAIALAMPDEMKTALANMALAPVLSPAKHYATALGGSGTPSLGTQVPWHDVFGCSEYLFYDMVILPLAKEFLDEIGAQLASAVSVYRQSQGGDDSESDEDVGTEDPPGFNTRRTIRELIKTKGKLPPGGGDKHHKAFLARFKIIMLDLVQEARGELPAANECSLEVAEEFFFLTTTPTAFWVATTLAVTLAASTRRAATERRAAMKGPSRTTRKTPTPSRSTRKGRVPATLRRRTRRFI